MYFPQGLCFSLPSACSDASQNWNKLELETKIAAAWGGRAALLLRLIPPTTLHQWRKLCANWSGLTEAPWLLLKCKSMNVLPPSRFGGNAWAHICVWGDWHSQRQYCSILSEMFLCEWRKKGRSWFRKPLWFRKWFYLKGKILSVSILQQSMYEWTF